MKVFIEIRAAEGGADARLLVNEQAGIYLRYALRRSLQAQVLDEGLG